MEISKNKHPNWMTGIHWIHNKIYDKQFVYTMLYIRIYINISDNVSTQCKREGQGWEKSV